jgi:hypothetical protein
VAVWQLTLLRVPLHPARRAGAVGPSLQPPPQQPRADLKVGWLEKRSGDSSSLNALPVDSWKWQRRWFVLAMESGFLYYFKSPQEMQTEGVAPKVVTIAPTTLPPAAAARLPSSNCVRRIIPLL